MDKKLHAGFARVEITPVKASVPIGGHGATEYRMSARVETPLYANVIALANGDERCVYAARHGKAETDDAFRLRQNHARVMPGIRLVIDGTDAADRCTQLGGTCLDHFTCQHAELLSDTLQAKCAHCFPWMCWRFPRS
ncbi:MAG: hypothetical protein IJ980_04630 [Oscillospiraceae bacterium]|nr:hypothetical protein [Oscillospiraceae bacterium]